MLARHFLGWERPFLGLLVDWLLARRDELPGLMVVVPTAQSGRLLREALAKSAGALLAPKVVTPEAFFRPAETAGIATAIESRLAWIEVLKAMSGREAKALFPVEPEERSFSWASGVARELEKVRNTLAEGGKFFQDVAELSPERDRWVDLVEVERRVLARIAEWKLEDPLGAKVRTAMAPTIPHGVRGLVIAGVPDPVPLAVEAWKRIGLPVSVLIHAPEEEREAFDVWGRPVIGETWIKRPVPVSQERVHLVAGPGELAAKVVSTCAGLASDQVTIGLCDAAFGPALESAFAEAGWPAWNPEGRMAGRPMLLMLKSFSGLVRRADRWDSASAILRNPLLAKILGDWNHQAAMRVLDDLEETNLPDSLARVRELCERRKLALESPDEGLEKLSALLDWCEAWRERFSGGNTAEALTAWVEAMAEVDDGADGQLLEALMEAVPPLKRLESLSLLRDAGEALDLALSSVETLRSAAGREEAVIDLSGWLELSHADGGRMILAGFHEGCVPDGNLDDGFLPDGVRKLLGLRDAESRHARDAFLFHSFAASRELEVVVAKVDSVGEPRRPSRLLLSATGVELAERVKALSGSPTSASERLASWSRGGWSLRFDEALKPYLDGQRTLSPSAIRDYLHCPFRFYLKRVLKWERHDAGKMEMDALDFGNLCHEALEHMGRDEEMSVTRDAQKLRDFLWEKMDARLARYGSTLSLPLLVQREAARSRMERFAELEVGQRLDGWTTKHVELQVGTEALWSIDGQTVKMQVDRVDFHPDLGWRVLDYKTSAKAETPRAAHLRRTSDKRRNLGPTMPAKGTAEDVWKNVQVPLYAAFLKEWKQLDAPPAIGYVNLPATLNEVGFELWEDFTQEQLDCAMEWSRGIIQALKQGVHWPPVELGGKEAGYDDFAALAPDGLEAAVSGKLIDDMKRIAREWDSERGVA